MENCFERHYFQRQQNEDTCQELEETSFCYHLMEWIVIAIIN